ncbi:MAG: flagellar basal body rod protein FlgB [Candidatus Sericytochromatia bacterium]|nr:flagellar basal body rod protein FlgB [Candidatus Tanganyikabacteria bacterium]
MLEGLFGDNVALLQKSLQGSTERAHAINENLANVDTPYYKKRQVEFESQLQRYRRLKRWDDRELAVTNRLHIGPNELATTNRMHMDVGPWSIANIKPASWRADSTTFRIDGNNVDVDYEMTLLAQTEMTYNAVAKMLTGRFEGLKSVIRGH